jgi:hypothetical protein
MGSVDYRRASYHCPTCHHGWHPTDAELQLETKRTRGAEEVISLTGVQESFEESADRVLHRLSGLQVSASTVRRVTEAAGQAVADLRATQQPIGTAEAWPWPHDKQGRTTAYVSLDATSVPQQGVHGERMEGRMAWVGSLFAPVPREAPAKRRLRRARYVSGLMSLDEIGQQLRQECRQLSVNEVDLTICLSDGGNGLETCLAEKVLAGISKQTVTILDFYHCAEHLSEFLAMWVGPERAEEESAQWRQRLKHEGGVAILNQLEALDLAHAPSTVCESHRQLCGYLRSNLHRTDYPTYLEHGWEIGSGEIESACKTIVCHRLKSAGMRWRPPGTTAICQLRALFKSDPHLWDDFWSRKIAL